MLLLSLDIPRGGGGDLDNCFASDFVWIIDFFKFVVFEPDAPASILSDIDMHRIPGLEVGQLNIVAI